MTYDDWKLRSDRDEHPDESDLEERVVAFPDNCAPWPEGAHFQDNPAPANAQEVERELTIDNLNWRDFVPEDDGRLRCADCGLLYSSEKWCDCVVSDDVWEKIERGSPVVLCFNCMAGRLVALGMDRVEVTIRSGPFRLAWDDKAAADLIASLRAQLDAIDKEPER